MTQDISKEAVEPEQMFLILKRDLYECPNHCGYTGIKDNAGQYTLEEVALSMPPDKYFPLNEHVYFIREEDAPEYTRACYWDVREAHIKDKLRALQARVAELESADMFWEYNHEEYPLDGFDDHFQEEGSNTVMHCMAAKLLPDFYVAMRVISIDEYGDTDETEVVKFATKEEAKHCYPSSLRKLRDIQGISNDQPITPHCPETQELPTLPSTPKETP